MDMPGGGKGISSDGSNEMSHSGPLARNAEGSVDYRGVIKDTSPRWLDRISIGSRTARALTASAFAGLYCPCAVPPLANLPAHAH